MFFNFPGSDNQKWCVRLLVPKFGLKTQNTTTAYTRKASKVIQNRVKDFTIKYNVYKRKIFCNGREKQWGGQKRC